MTRLDLFAASALAGLLAHPHLADAHPMTGDATKLAQRALALGKALDALLPAEEAPEAPQAPAAPSVGSTSATKRR